MQTDRELLELAARANWAQEVADDEISLRYCEINDGILYLLADNQDHNGHDREFVWNPLTDDGDALRLLASLRLDLSFVDAMVEICWFDHATKTNRYVEEAINDAQGEREATRRAIVRAAAEIGTNPKQHNGGGADAQD